MKWHDIEHEVPVIVVCNRPLCLHLAESLEKVPAWSAHKGGKLSLGKSTGSIRAGDSQAASCRTFPRPEAEAGSRFIHHSRWCFPLLHSERGYSPHYIPMQSGVEWGTRCQVYLQSDPSVGGLFNSENITEQLEILSQLASNKSLYLNWLSKS